MTSSTEPARVREVLPRLGLHGPRFARQSPTTKPTGLDHLARRARETRVVPATRELGKTCQTTQQKGGMPDNVLTENEYRTFRRIAAQETGTSQSVLSFDSRLVQLIDGHFNREEDSFAVLANSPASAGRSSKVSCSEGAAVPEPRVGAYLHRSVRLTAAVRSQRFACLAVSCPRARPQGPILNLGLDGGGPGILDLASASRARARARLAPEAGSAADLGAPTAVTALRGWATRLAWFFHCTMQMWATVEWTTRSASTTLGGGAPPHLRGPEGLALRRLSPPVPVRASSSLYSSDR